MARKRVYVIWTHPLFYESIRLLLDREVDLVGSSTNHAVGNRQISEMKPDVVIIETPKGMKDLETETIAILQEGPKVIHLSLEDNELNLYQRQHKTMDQSTDLMRMILELEPKQGKENGENE